MTATPALVVALAGTSFAALKVGSRQIVNNSVRGMDLPNNSVAGKDVRKGRTLFELTVGRRLQNGRRRFSAKAAAPSRLSPSEIQV
ncbi:MAG TPA: hypothetical protein VFQ12_09125 [Thermoleophilaceae bacterium]|nr:hypothetical protein [Thermoleophilaceae bacterium]